jgi:hypothetical protein
MQRLNTFILAVLSPLCTGCGAHNTEPYFVSPIVRVSAGDEVSGSPRVDLSVGRAAKLVLVLYSPTDALNAAGVTWTTRNAAIATNVGSTVTGASAGSAYVVGEVTYQGVLYRDSVLVVVAPR